MSPRKHQPSGILTALTVVAFETDALKDPFETLNVLKGSFRA